VFHVLNGIRRMYEMPEAARSVLAYPTRRQVIVLIVVVEPLKGVTTEIPFTVKGIKIAVSASLDKPLYNLGDTAVPRPLSQPIIPVRPPSAPAAFTASM